MKTISYQEAAKQKATLIELGRVDVEIKELIIKGINQLEKKDINYIFRHNLENNAKPNTLLFVYELVLANRWYDYNLPSEILKQYIKNYWSSPVLGYQRTIALQKIKYFIKYESAARYSELTDQIKTIPELEHLIIAMNFADHITDNPFLLKLRSFSQLVSIFPDSSTLYTIIQDNKNDFIDRVKNNISKYYNFPIFIVKGNLRLVHIISDQVAIELNNELLKIQHLITTDLEKIKEFFAHEAGLICQIFSTKTEDSIEYVSAISIYDLVNSNIFREARENGVREDDKIKQHTLKFYKKLYQKIPEILIILSRLEQNSVNLTEEETNLFSKALIHNIGRGIYEILDLEFRKSVNVTKEEILNLICKFPPDMQNFIKLKCEFYKTLNLKSEPELELDFNKKSYEILREYHIFQNAQQDKKIKELYEQNKNLNHRVENLEQQMLLQQGQINQLLALHSYNLGSDKELVAPSGLATNYGSDSNVEYSILTSD